MPNETGGTRGRSGGMSVSLASPDGRVVGGGVAGLLVAASPVQVRGFLYLLFHAPWYTKKFDMVRQSRNKTDLFTRLALEMELYFDFLYYVSNPPDCTWQFSFWEPTRAEEEAETLPRFNRHANCCSPNFNSRSKGERLDLTTFSWGQLVFRALWLEKQARWHKSVFPRWQKLTPYCRQNSVRSPVPVPCFFLMLSVILLVSNNWASLPRTVLLGLVDVR